MWVTVLPKLVGEWCKGCTCLLMVIDKGHRIVGTGLQQCIVQDMSQIGPPSTGMVKVIV